MLLFGGSFAAMNSLRLGVEWDESKRLSNIDKHDMDFRRACDVFDGRPRLDIESPRRDEHRTLTISMLNGTLIAVTWTRRAENSVRLISVRRARRAEDRKYRQIYG
jgi:uncharacterized protein